MLWIIWSISLLGLIYCAYHAYIILRGSLTKLDPIPYARPEKRLAVVIPARNEARVVGGLVSSLKRQHYPKALYDIYVVPNNCTDDTEAAARKAGARILHCQSPVHSKGEVLSATFERLLKAPEKYDGFIIFDADNVADRGFLQAANNALCAGYQVGQAYRDSKNPNDSWVAGCTSVFFWFMNRLFNQPRAALGLSSPLNGTGILIGAQMLRQHGYRTFALTEDLEFTAQCALAGVKIAWMPEAITYDEQPIKFKDSWTQRRRWAAGTRQCLVKYGLPLYKKAGKSRICLDVALHFSGVVVQMLSLIPGILTAVLLGMEIAADPMRGLGHALAALVLWVCGCVLGGMALVLLVCLLEKKFCRERLVDMAAMGWYLLTWLPANIVGNLLPAPKWKEIPHVSQADISQCDGSGREMPLRKKETETL